MAGFFTTARANATLCFSPPLRRSPRSPSEAVGAIATNPPEKMTGFVGLKHACRCVECSVVSTPANHPPTLVRYPFLNLVVMLSCM